MGWIGGEVRCVLKASGVSKAEHESGYAVLTRRVLTNHSTGPCAKNRAGPAIFNVKPVNQGSLSMNVKSEKLHLIAAALAATVLSGCATYRTDSNIASGPTSAVSSKADVLITEGVPDKKYKVIGPIEVSVKKLTIFHDDPTKEQANKALVEKARVIGADAVIKVTYESGIGFTTWGYIDAKGTGVKLAE